MTGSEEQGAILEEEYRPVKEGDPSSMGATEVFNPSQFQAAVVYNGHARPDVPHLGQQKVLPLHANTVSRGQN